MVEISLFFEILCLIFVIVAVVYGLRPYFSAGKHVGLLPEESSSGDPKVSVIVCSQSDEDVLEATLTALSTQDYPNYEVIVVCDGSAEYAAMLTERFGALYPDTYFTFVQPGSHNVSRRKLAITLGVKAAKGEVIVTTLSNISIPSDQWLSQLVSPFRGEAGRHCDVSLGLSKMDFAELRGGGKWFRQFDSLLINALWVGYAMDGHPYRGDGFNLVFRKSVFFEHKGYSRTINLHYGDDDLFINEIANAGNTKVVISPDNILTTLWGSSANRIWGIMKERYAFNVRWLPKAPFFNLGLLCALQWLVPATAVAALLCGGFTLIHTVIPALLVLLFWGIEIFCYRKVASKFGMVRLWWAVVPFWLWYPVYNFIFSCRHRQDRKKNFTWQR